MNAGRPWYEDPTTILGELRRSDPNSGATPDIEGYEGWEELGRGGQGVVYRATQRSTRRPVAIKVLHEGPLENASRRLRFEREVEAVGALQHPGVVRVYDSGTTADGRLYYVMEEVEGETLDRALAKLGDPGEPAVRRQVVERILQVSEAVEHAHRRGVIHRDLKPGNVIVDRDGVPRIVDFGIARLVDSDDGATQEGQFIGSLATAAPEQLEGDSAAIDVRTDVYALGVLLYLGITGELPHDPSLGTLEAMRAIVEQDPEPPSRRRARSRGERPARRPDDLDAITLRALARDPERRYPSAAALVGDLRRCLTGRPIEAKLDDFGYVFRKMLARHRIEVAGAVLLIVAIVAFGVVTAILLGRTELEIGKAEQIRVFLEDTFGSVEPRRPGEPVTMAATLDEAVHWVEIALTDQPEIEASLRHTIGNSYRAIGRLEEAEAQLTLALDLRREVHGGERHLEVAQTLNGFGLVRRDQGRIEEAETFFRRGLEIRRDLLGSRDPAVSSSLVNLARLRLLREDPAEAERLLTEALEIRLEHNPADHPDVAMVRFDLGRVAEARGEKPEAIGLHREALKSRIERLHPDHPDVARSQLTVVRLLLEVGDPNAALPIAAACHTARRDFLGAEDDRTLEAEGWLGAALWRSGRAAEGRAHLIPAWEGLRSHTGPETPRLRGLAPYLEEASVD